MFKKCHCISVLGIQFSSIYLDKFYLVEYKISDNGNLVVRDSNITRTFPKHQFLWEVIDI